MEPNETQASILMSNENRFIFGLLLFTVYCTYLLLRFYSSRCGNNNKNSMPQRADTNRSLSCADNGNRFKISEN